MPKHRPLPPRKRKKNGGSLAMVNCENASSSPGKTMGHLHQPRRLPPPSVLQKIEAAIVERTTTNQIKQIREQRAVNETLESCSKSPLKNSESTTSNHQLSIF